MALITFFYCHSSHFVVNKQGGGRAYNSKSAWRTQNFRSLCKLFMKDHLAIVKLNQRVAQSTFLLALEPTGAPLDAQPGQFVMLRVGSGTDPLLRRPFSIAGFDRTGALLILYRVLGKGTALMSQWRPGARTKVLGPLGKGFDLASTEGISIMVAGGIGVAPLVFLSQELGSSRKILLMGSKTYNELIPIEDLVGGDVVVHLATEDGSTGHMGLVTELLGSTLGELEADKTMVYACGPEAMLKEISRICWKKGVSCQVSTEAVMACGVGACQGCAIRAKNKERQYYHVCKDGPVFDIKEIVWEEI